MLILKAPGALILLLQPVDSLMLRLATVLSFCVFHWTL